MTGRARTIPMPGVPALAVLVLVAWGAPARASVCCDQFSGLCTLPDGAGGCPAGYALLSGGACTPSPCAAACCDLFSGGCTVIGVFGTCVGGVTGFGAVCSPSPCPQPGACCFTSSGSCSFVPANTCQINGGEAQATGAACAPGLCNGACCNLTTGACVPGVQVTCAGGQFRGIGTVCGPNPCAQPAACCNGANGSCCFAGPTGCGGGVFQSAGTLCGPNPCPQPTACCDLASGSCSVALPGSGCAPGAAAASPASTTCLGVDCAGPPPPQTLLFADRTAAAHLNAVHTAFPPSASLSELALETGGVAVGDFNNDGFQDVFVLGGLGAPDRLYMNQGDGTFTDRAAAWGVDRTHWGFGIAVGDYNGDGLLDVFITSGGTDGQHCHHILYRNNGNGTFTDVALAAGVGDTTGGGVFDGFGCAWGDYDLDGRLDLAVAGWVTASGGNRLFHNNGNGTFTDVTPALGYDMTYVTGFSPRFIDMNGDRYPELLWVSDFGTSRYFINNRNGRFTEARGAAGVGLDANGMGVAVGDFNGDGRPDWYVTSIYSTCQTVPQVPGTGDMLYLNLGNHHFTEVSNAAGVKRAGWAWGAVVADFRNIGRLDIGVTNGWQGSNYNGEFLFDATCLFLNNGDGTFRRTDASCGVDHTGQGRGMATFDYDNDGRPDLLIATNGGPLTLYHNETTGTERNYLRVFLNTHASHGLAPNGIGAHVVATVDGVAQHRWITSGSNYLSQSEMSAHFGLGGAEMVNELRIVWPSGEVTTRVNVPVNQSITVSSCPGDWNADGAVSVQDIFDFLGAWFGGHADFNASGATTVQDVFDFLGAWFGVCP